MNINWSNGHLKLHMQTHPGDQHMAANAVLGVVCLATHGEVLLIQEAKPRETPETHIRMGISIL